jgi:starch synthase
MPSRYEPCGLNQMYSLRYGTVPVVRATGGLADTVAPYDRVSGQGTGFLFEEFSSQALFGAVRRALDVWADRPAWQRLMQNGMRQDFSWQRQGEHYVRLYRSLAAR